jgi:hypothetical protein
MAQAGAGIRCIKGHAGTRANAAEYSQNISLRICEKGYVSLYKPFFMTAKLTLSIGVQTIKRAKLLSRKRGTSISRLVEDFLNSLPDEEEKHISAARQLRGIGGKVSADTDWKKLRAQYINGKYGQ